ncbi:MAG: hypothetical protein Q4D05_06225 [Acinetobacter sp.]|nr:hypothetical protein [Acinetobacter sp.]
MSLAFTLDEQGFAGLDEPLQGLYHKNDDGSYQLKVDGLPTEGLKAKNEQLLGETKKEREKRKELEKQLAEVLSQKEQAMQDELKQKGNIDALEKSYQEKFDKLQHESNSREHALQQQIYQLTVGQTATNLANELAIKGSANVLLPHIQNRLTLDDSKIRVLDLQGNISALTLDDLKQEFRSNDAFKPLIAGNHSSGSGATGHHQQAQPLKRSEMTAKDVAEFIEKHGQTAYLKLPK